MITQVREGFRYVNVSVGITNNDGKAIDPVTAEAWFYKVSQADGSIALDTNINGTGKVSLSKQDSQTGFYGGSVNIVSLTEAEYIILYKVTIDGTETLTVESLSIDLSKKEIAEIKPETDKIQLIKDETDKIKFVLGLTQSNFRIFNPVYDADHQLTSATIKTYPTKADCDNDTNPIAEYHLAAAYNVNGEMTEYKLVKV